MIDLILDALKDTALLIPWLLAVHIFISIVEANNMKKISRSSLLKGKAAPVVGTAVSLIPQCGFSVIASELYSSGRIQVGTLIAIFIATSDEAVPIILSSAVTDATLWKKLFLILLIKVVMALVAGYVLNFCFGKRKITEGDLPEDTKYGCCGHAVVGAPKECEENEHHHHEHDHHESRAAHIWHTYFKHPLIHTLILSLYILGINFVLGLIIYLVNTYAGENAFQNFLQQSIWIQPVLSSAVGLIPNCASSVLISEMFAGGGLTLGATVSGLSVNAGLGIAVLLKENKNIKENVLIITFLVLYALTAGYIITLIMA